MPRTTEEAAIDPRSICAVVLAGGRAMRMGGVDKGLQLFKGQPLVWHALQRLQAQVPAVPGLIGINANRNLDDYAQWGHPVWSDASPDFAGPLAGFATALQHALGEASAPSLPYTYLLVVPCDSPLFPLNLLQRLALALTQTQADIAVVTTDETYLGDVNDQARKAAAPSLRAQPVFCLLRTALQRSLNDYLAAGGRKIETWMRQHKLVEVPFNSPTDDPKSFCNANTLAQLNALEQQ